MTNSTTPALEDAGTTGRIDARDARALTECMTVLADVGEARGADGLYRVVGENGDTYTVDARSGACTCPDARHRNPDGGCKHARRVAYATGERGVPAFVDTDAVDAQLGAHVDATPQVAAADGGGEIIDAGDEGEILGRRDAEAEGESE